MVRAFKILLFFSLVVILSSNAFALNGDNLIGVGPVSRAMGGVGVAAPQDAVSALFANPAAISSSEADFAITILVPDVEGKIDLSGMGMGAVKEESRMNPFFIPAVGITSSITDKLKFGIGAFGVSGMGVDYKDTSPLFSDLFVKLEVLKVSPAVAYLINQNLSLGASVNVSYSNFDMGRGSAHNFSSVGAQLGILYTTGIFRIGASYSTPQKVEHENVYDLDLDGSLDTIDIEAPQSVAFGVAVEPINGLLLEANTKWYNWADAEGYKDFDWEDQWVFALGAQYKPITKLAIRAGFNYGKNPVKVHDGFNPLGTTDVQGKAVPNLNYEVLRIIGTPLIIEKHITFGIGYDVSEKVAINIGYAHAFEETISETSLGGMAVLESTVKGDSYEFGITWKF